MFSKLVSLIIALTSVVACMGASAFIARHPPSSAFADIFPSKNPNVKDGLFGPPYCNGVRCMLCPFKCYLPEGMRGRCRVRMNSNGKLKTLVYGKPISVHIDPIEKKPVYHLLPGSLIYSLATAGCNLSCKACQNWEISQIFPEQTPSSIFVPSKLELTAGPDGRIYGTAKNEEAAQLLPEKIVEYALATKSKSIAYTYSEPVIFYEYMHDTAVLAKKSGIKNVMVSAGYINPEPLSKLLPFMDVVKIDLKGFDEDFYENFSGGKLRYVQETLLELKKNNTMTEVVNLVVPSLNDGEESFRAMSKWIKENMGAGTPVFFSRFSPGYRLQNLPQTPVETLTKARDIAMKEGLHYVYVGNVAGHEGETTYCPKCKRPLVQRYGYAILKNLLTPGKGKCPFDGTKIPGIWNE